MTAMTASIGRFWSRLWGEPPAQGPDALPVRVHGTEFTRTGAAPVRVKGFDQPLAWVTLGLLLCHYMWSCGAPHLSVLDNKLPLCKVQNTHLWAHCGCKLPNVC